MINVLLIAIKLCGFLLGAIALEDKLNDAYASYLILYSLVGFLAFISEMGVYYSVSNQRNSNKELQFKMGSILLTSSLSSMFGLLFSWVYIRLPENSMVIIFLILPIIINLSSMLRGILIKENDTLSPAIYDTLAFGVPGYIFYLFTDDLDLTGVCSIILASHLVVLSIVYIHVGLARSHFLIPNYKFAMNKFEKNMLYSNMVASPLGHMDLWLLLYFVPDVSSKALLVRDLASKIPNLLFPFLQIYLYPKMVSADNRRMALSEFYKTSTLILLIFSCGIIFLKLLSDQFINVRFNEIISFFPIVLFFAFRAIGSFLAPLMMYEVRSDLSLLRNFVHTLSFICFGIIAYFIIIKIHTNTLYIGYILMQIVLTIFDIILTKKITGKFINPYTIMYLIFNITTIIYVYSIF